MFKENNYPSSRFKPLKILFFIGVFIAIVSILSWVVMLLWNAILPDVVGVKPLTFWKAVGLLILAKILFGGFGGRRGHGKHSKGGHWRNKWMGMDDGKRQEAKSRWKEYCKQRDSREKND